MKILRKVGSVKKADGQNSAMYAKMYDGMKKNTANAEKMIQQYKKQYVELLREQAGHCESMIEIGDDGRNWEAEKNLVQKTMQASR